MVVSSRTILWTAKTLIVSPRHQYKTIVRTLAPRALLQALPGLEQYAPPPGLAIDAHLCTPHGIPVNAAPLRPWLRSAISVTPPQPPACTIHVGTHHARSATAGKRSASTALAGTHNLADTVPRAGTRPFPKPRAIVLPLVHFGQSKPEGHSGLDTADSDLMHHQFRLSLLQWNPGPARRNPTNIVSAACGKFHAVILQGASDHVPHISDQFMAYTGNTDLAILLNKDTFEPDPKVLTFKADSTSKGTLGMVLHIVRGLLRRPSLSGSPTVTLSSGHIHNDVAKKRDASTDLLQRLHGYMCEHNVDFIRGSVHTNGVWIRMAATNLTILRLALVRGISLVTSLFSSTCATPIYPDPAVSCVVSKRNKKDLSADATTNEGRDEVHDHALVHHGHVNVSFLTLLR